jgi:hypothetical protein
MERERARVRPVEPAQEGEKLLVTVAGVALADHRSLEQVERGKVGGQSVGVGARNFCIPRPEQVNRLEALLRLDPSSV